MHYSRSRVSSGTTAGQRPCRRPRTVAVLVSAIALLSCGEATTAPPPPPPPLEPVRPASLSISPSDLRFEALGDTARFVTEVRDQNGQVVSGAAVTLESGDPSVATVDAAGLATAVANGRVTIIATAEAASGAATVTVDQVVVDLAVSPSSIRLALDDSLRLAVEASDANGHPVTDPRLAWRSTDEAIATVDATGLLIGVGVGTATVHATSGPASADAGVEVLSGADADRLVLTTLYEVTDGAGWIHDDNWLADLPLADWYGVGVNDEGRVTELDLEANNLVGPIPAALSHLTRLTELNLIRNSLNGTIPSELGTLARLEVLGLGINRLTGPLPSELGKLSRLRELHIYRNPLSGGIPGELANLDRLEKFVVYWTDIAGPIPQTFLRLERLKEIAALRTPVCVPGTAAFARWLENIRIAEFEGSCNRTDVAVLTGLYRATGGENWIRSSGWGTGVALETWLGCPCRLPGSRGRPRPGRQRPRGAPPGLPGAADPAHGTADRQQRAEGAASPRAREAPVTRVPLRRHRTVCARRRTLPRLVVGPCIPRRLGPAVLPHGPGDSGDALLRHGWPELEAKRKTSR
ncbi:Ig-like domain-containing protein [Candidatus Palauibacter sp.]|uniref:Ig-like domain-containing protein n=1 Tax=Candidatus Palauibacter sp. TaxID=3101350 RepID=UPI003B51EBF1